MRMNAYLAFVVLALVGSLGTFPGATSTTTPSRLHVKPFSPKVNTKAEVRVRSKTLQGYRPPFKIESADCVIKNVYRTEATGVTHVYLRQVVKGIEVGNGDLSINIDKQGHVVAYGNSFFQLRDKKLARRAQLWDGHQTAGFVKPSEALRVLADYIGQPLNAGAITLSSSESRKYVLKGVPFAVQDVTATQAYLQLAGDQLVPAWEYTLRMPHNYFHAHVSADGKQVLSLVDWVKDASYRAIKFGNNNPIDTPTELIDNPADKIASPHGWHDQGEKQFTTTIGNNVYAQENIATSSEWENNYRPDGGKGLKFDYAADLTKEPAESKDASITNLFYMNNILHDLFYRYGFDEPAGNFQENNWGKGGQGGDAVQANALDGSETNNADFTTPPDGQRPMMRMFIFTTVSPSRDGALGNDIITHEYGHGVSNRLTGGPANSDCLSEGQSAAMGEGISDFFAIWSQMKEEDTPAKDMIIGKYVTNTGIRTYPYSNNNGTNPLAFGHLNDPEWSDWHKSGEIWANTLYKMYWNLVTKLGFSKDMHSADLTKGNTLALRLVIDSLKIQPCNPSFLNARDAILQAEQQLTAGKHKCAIWSAFAKSGMGLNAKSDANGVVESFDMPSDCA
ncbi:Fungalysin metallopeptidase-domain-containing protein [Thamnocephalis sphaerospora]|uniref:Extracellular metalloproteinase n=1 Tax=Thamnocephalis sphaerospora TaxID=78915 RepID=A0A4P9XRH0_9FUNG|nr:Fungalysin metallopeptidase-domain-containing protein [Thamnocephalis sphaerospora]|eukprot:RKP08675.1 Fungalysin metallopeptidase-domain-containing protein [Thamnocephalis sphaerospora]